jgi:hypothetical protein
MSSLSADCGEEDNNVFRTEGASRKRGVRRGCSIVLPCVEV